MARSRHIGVLLVVATLLLWGSAAAATTSLSTSGGAVDTASTAQVQQQEQNASVTFEDQTVENGSVTIANVTLPEGGYVTIHNDSLRDAQAVGSVIGVSEYLEPGTHENVTVTLYEGVEGANFENATMPNGTETLIAMPHMETSEQMAGNETTTTEDGVGDNQTTTTTEDGLNDTETTTTEAGTNDTETTTTQDGQNDTETTTTEAGANDTETTTEAGTNDTETTTEAGANDTQTTGQQNQTYDFVATDGQEDGPYVVDGAVVTDSAEVDFAGPMTEDGAGAGGADTNETQTNDTQANETQGESSFVVESIEAPSLAASNATITVNATISNSADEERTEDVAFRLAGGDADVVVHQEASVGASGNETVTFEVNASDVGEGEYIHGVTTENSSKFATIEVTDDAQVVMGDQEIEGDTVTVESVYLPEGGYVALHDASLLGGDAVGSVVGSSEYLEPGVHENVTVTLSEGGAATQDNATQDDTTTTEDGQNDTTTTDDAQNDTTTEDETTTTQGDDAQNNASDQGNNASAQANGSQGGQPLVAMAHQETNDNEEFDFVSSDGEDDGPYTVDGEPVVDAANLTVALENTPSGNDEDSTDN